MGFTLRRLMTSASTPYFFFSSSAAVRDWPTQRERVTIVRSEPARSILALPKGRVKSGNWAASDMGKCVPYRSLAGNQYSEE